jgi:hypothetical protein
MVRNDVLHLGRIERPDECAAKAPLWGRRWRALSSPRVQAIEASDYLKAATACQRTVCLPFLKAGLSGFAADSWFGVMAPAGTSGAVVAKLNADIWMVTSL